MPYSPDLDALLTVGARYVKGDVTYVLEVHRLDDVVLPSGQVVGCDPLVFSEDAAPFTVTVPSGAYPLMAWVAVLHREDQEWQRRVAALQLVVGDQPVSRWEMALVDGDDPGSLDENGYFGYPVDAGAGTLADLVAIRALAEWDYERVDRAYIPAQLPEAPVPGALAAVTDDTTGANVVVTNSGWGDGGYPTFIGYAADGTVTSFVTDFMVVPSPE